MLKQLVAYVGSDGVHRRLPRVLPRHAYGNTTLADLLGRLERASGRDLAAWSRAWLQTSGISELTPDGDDDPDGRITRLVVIQSATDPATGGR